MRGAIQKEDNRSRVLMYEVMHDAKHRYVTRRTRLEPEL
jgi:hypothetical protein